MPGSSFRWLSWLSSGQKQERKINKHAKRERRAQNWGLWGKVMSHAEGKTHKKIPRQPRDNPKTDLFMCLLFGVCSDPH